MRIHLKDSDGDYHISDVLEIEEGATEEEVRENLDDLFKQIFTAKYFSMPINKRVTYFNPAHIINIVVV